MLVLSRKVGERLVIGENITVVVTKVAGNRVTLGIEAPNDVRVVRAELRPTQGLEKVSSTVPEAASTVNVEPNVTVSASRAPSLPVGKLAGFVPRVAK